MKDTIKKIKALSERVATVWGLLGLDESQKQIDEIQAKMTDPEFWNDQSRAKDLTKELDALKDEAETWTAMKSDVDELLEMAEMALKEDGEHMEEDVNVRLRELFKKFEKMEFVVLLDEKYDRHNAIVAIHSGTGGTEAQDWAQMLERMILRHAESKGWQVETYDRSRGQEAGIKSVTMRVSGRWAYGQLKSEHGVHRLVRISPFDAEKMRHTSFALMEVIPELEEAPEAQIDPSDLRVDTFMASGHGGQSVNTTYSAVRMVHKPTGVTVTCQNERSQQQNKATCMKILQSRLTAIKEEEARKEKDELRGEHAEAAWGNQIRSYVLHPYKQVKDHRTGFVSKEPDKVLDGELDGFMEAYLRWKKGKIKK